MFILCLIIGFFAQLIDGTLGMAYGVCCTTLLQSVCGVSSLISSALVHFSEIFTTGVSAISHFKMKNVDKKKFFKLLIPGVLGGIVGATLLSTLGGYLEKAVSVYLILMGIWILIQAFQKNQKQIKERDGLLYVIATAGGLLDATGGGGWGPVVTTTMLCTNNDVPKTIGTVNTVEFFVTLAESVVFTVSVANVMQYKWELLALIIGGVIAAPIAALLCKKINKRVMLFLVGVLVIGLNVYKLFW